MITNYKRGDNPGSTVITVCELFYDTLGPINKPNKFEKWGLV